MNVAIDLGNSSAKAGLFEEEQLLKSYVALSEASLRALCEEKKPARIILSSVRNESETEKLAEELQRDSEVLLLKSSTSLPITLRYRNAHTLGADRVAAAAGASVLHPDTACLIIDAGTSVTYDLLDAAGNFQGGSISLGIRMRLQALHHFTARLPLLSENISVWPPLHGQSTEEAIYSGVLQGICFEMEGFIRAYRKNYENLKVLLSGGSAVFFESRIKEEIFAMPNLVLIGLNSILRHNS